MHEYFRIVLVEALQISMLIKIQKKVLRKVIFDEVIPWWKFHFSRLLGYRIVFWDEIWFVGIIFDAKHDCLRVFQKFDDFQKSQNQLWIQPFWRPLIKRSLVCVCDIRFLAKYKMWLWKLQLGWYWCNGTWFW